MRAEDAIAYVSDWIKVARRSVPMIARDAEAFEYLRGCARELQDLAGTQARIRRLEKDINTAREANERERRSNGTLALELHEARAELNSFGVAEANLRSARRSRFARAWKLLAKNLRADWLATLDDHDIAMTAQWESAMEAMGPERLTAADGYLCEAVKDLHAEVTKANALLADYEKRWGRVLRMGAYVRGIVPRASAWSEDYRLCATHIIANFPELLGKSEPLADGELARLPIPCEEDPSGLGVVVVATREMAIEHMRKGGLIECEMGMRRMVDGDTQYESGGVWRSYNNTPKRSLDSRPGYYTLLPITTQQPEDALARTCGAE